uniref:hypothetical protein n=1 Tax=Deinococcus frigens TaxID=249403 RepID=UPI001B802DFC
YSGILPPGEVFSDYAGATPETNSLLISIPLSCLLLVPAGAWRHASKHFPNLSAPPPTAYQEEDAHSSQRAQDDPFEWVRGVRLRQCHQHGMMEIPVPLRACHLIEVAREALEFLVQLLPTIGWSYPIAAFQIPAIPKILKIVWIFTE